MSSRDEATNSCDRPVPAPEIAECRIVPFEPAQAKGVRDLFVDINRELAPSGMEEAFAAYVRRALQEEIDRIQDYFDTKAGNGFWVVTDEGSVVGMFGLERRSDTAVELRRMYLKKSYRGRGIASRMLERAEVEASGLGYKQLVLSTADIQAAAVVFYNRNGFRQVRTEIAESQDHKTVGGGLTRRYFEKDLCAAVPR